MKKILLFLILLIIFPLYINCNFSYASPNYSVYAKIYNNCKLYTDLSLNESECLFILPESYFVIILDDEFDKVYKVQYKNYVGYVLKDKVEICSFVPNQKFLDGITLDIRTTYGTQIWQRPSDNSKTLTTVSAGTKNINYISFVYGDIPSGGVSNLWYYVSYTSSEFSTNVYEGYVYSENTINLSPIKYNLEQNPEIISNNTNLNFSSSDLIKTIIIAIIVIPIILFILFILHKLTKKYKKNTNEDIILNNKIHENLAPENNSNENLKNEIKKFKVSNFIKKRKNNNLNTEKYPIFPSYENDDWL